MKILIFNKKQSENRHSFFRNNRYPIHMFCAYLLVVFGALALLSRAIERLSFLHVYAGRAFLVTMYWAMGTSILIHNT